MFQDLRLGARIISMRVALGAARSRIVRQMMAETLVIAVPGGVLGLVLATGGLHMLVAVAPAWPGVFSRRA